MTAPISVPWVRDTLLPTALAWDMSSNAASVALIQGWTGANFAGVQAGDTVTIGQGASAPSVITFAGTDVTAALVATKINATWAGLATVVGSAIVLSHASRVRVTAISDTVFARIGLPVMDRDRSLTAASSISASVSATAAANTLETVSAVVAVPAGSNRANLLVKLTNAGGFTAGVDIGLIWMPIGVTITPTLLADFPFLASVSGTLAADTQDNPFGYQKVWAGIARHVGSFATVSSLRQTEFTVPPGAGSLRILVGQTYRESSTTPPTIPPTVSGYIAFGAR